MAEEELAVREIAEIGRATMMVRKNSAMSTQIQVMYIDHFPRRVIALDKA